MITYTKLRDGSWGLRVVGEDVRENQRVEVTKKDGSRKHEIVGRRLFAIEGGGIYTIKQAARKPNRDWPGKICPACGSEPLDRNLHCWECGYTGRP